MSALNDVIQFADNHYGIDDRIRPDDLIMRARRELDDLQTKLSQSQIENCNLRRELVTGHDLVAFIIKYFDETIDGLWLRAAKEWIKCLTN